MGRQVAGPVVVFLLRLRGGL
ncbi:MAG: photosystem II reaction center protein Ycf12 [Gammaproteobacteria bacterium]|nr:photosystem II reaction center protein Ycf12 [Gammaproteobacteria bacterium]